MSHIKKGIILAGGTGSRLYPVTKSINKHLLPIYDKPMIFYALTTLMLSGIHDILIIISPEDLSMFESIIGKGDQWGVKISYNFQTQPKGIAEAFLIGEKFIDSQPVCLILGDNFFHGHGLSHMIENSITKNYATVFAIPVDDAERFGVVTLDHKGQPTKLIEKPKNAESNLAVTGLYFYDENVVEYAKQLVSSTRGELEITDLNKIYLEKNRLKVNVLGRGMAWFDMGIPSALLQVANYVNIVQSKQSLGIGFPEEVAWRMNYIDDKKMKNITKEMKKSEYKDYLEKILSWK